MPNRHSQVRLSFGRERAWWFPLGCGALAVAIVAVFNLIFYDHYAPLPEGWFSVYADLIRKGQLPYRDIYFFLPPVFPLFITAVQAVLGPEIIMLRLVGVLIILICTGALFKILHECFGPVAAFFAAVAGMIYYQTGVAHIGYDFFQVMNLAMLLACVCLLRFNRNLQQGRHTTRATPGWPLLIGVCAAIALFTKQSNGFFIAASLAVAVLYAGGRVSRTWAVRGLVWFSLGFGLVAGALLFWLVATGSLTACLGMIFGGAAASKGGLGQIFFGFIAQTVTGDLISRLMALLILGLPLGFGSLWLLKLEPAARLKLTGNGWEYLTVIAGAAGLLTAILMPWVREGGLPGWIPEFLSNYVTLSMIPSALLGTGLILMAWLVGALDRSHPSSASPLFLTALVSAGVLWGNGTSGGLSEGGAFLGSSLFVGLLLRHGGWLRLGGLAVAAVLCLQLCISTEVKYRTPYYWWGVQEPDIRLPHVPANQPLLKGLWVTPERNETFDRITAIIQRETLPGEPILVFPQTPIFYLLADRPMMGHAVVHWFDFLPDNLARREMDLFETQPPALILLMEMPDEVYLAHENLFRAGRRSAQREMVEKIHQMLSEDSYDEIAVIPLNPNYSFRILKRK